jgi:hypothetical protein
MSGTFNVILRSINKEAGEYTNDCHLTPIIPSSHNNKALECRVIGFMNDVPNNVITAFVYDVIAELVCEDLSIHNQSDTNKGQGKTLAMAQVDRYQSVPRITFRCDNFSNKRLRFQLKNMNGSTLLNDDNSQWNYNWVVILECKPID